MVSGLGFRALRLGFGVLGLGIQGLGCIWGIWGSGVLEDCVDGRRL